MDGEKEEGLESGHEQAEAGDDAEAIIATNEANARLIAAAPDLLAALKDIIEGVTVHEDLDEITGLSRLIIVDSADEKKRKPELTP